MPFEIIHVQKERFPALRLVGKRFTRADCGPGGFGEKHAEWSKNLRCHELAKLGFADSVERGLLGLMTLNADHQKQPREQHRFAYWIGHLFPPQTPAPDGYSCIDLPESDVGVAWIRGDCGSIFGETPHFAALEKLKAHGMGALRENAGGDNTLVFFERYAHARFKPDARGLFTLDYGFYLA